MFLVGSSLPAIASDPKPGRRRLLAFCVGKKNYLGHNQIAPDEKSQFVLLNPENLEERRQTPLPFLGHSFSQNPAKSDEVFIVCKWGVSAALVSIKESKALQILTARPKTRFFGHAVHSPKGDALFVSVQNDLSEKGEIEVRDPTTLEIRQVFLSGGRRPHDVHFDEKENALIVANSGSATALTWIDAQTGEIKKSVKPAKAKGAGFAHFAVSANGFIAVGKGDEGTPGWLHRIQNEKGFAIPTPEGPLSGEVLSVADYGSENLFLVTAPDAERILLVDWKTGKVKFTRKMDRPTGVAKWKDRFLVGASKTGVIYEVEPRSQKINEFAKIALPPGEELSPHFAWIEA